MRVTFIGSGNVATVLARKVLHGGHIIHQVFSRTPQNAKSFADEFSVSIAGTTNALDEDADIFVVAVSDNSLQNIGTWMKPVNKLIVHTAGSVSMDVLKDISPDYGVLYPLQSLRKEMPRLPYIPMIVDANTPWNAMKLSRFAQSFTDSVCNMSDDERRKFHLAAVISNNFSNYLFALTEHYCNDEHLDFTLLLPLLEETVKRLSSSSPAALQTGPAIRRDEATLATQRTMLKAHPGLLEVYNFFTERIMKMYS
jgi:predicted short-subunit dehydrogenase-like oxidoreductase (DUF2520 family)